MKSEEIENEINTDSKSKIVEEQNKNIIEDEINTDSKKNEEQNEKQNENQNEEQKKTK